MRLPFLGTTLGAGFQQPLCLWDKAGDQIRPAQPNGRWFSIYEFESVLPTKISKCLTANKLFLNNVLRRYSGIGNGTPEAVVVVLHAIYARLNHTLAVKHDLRAI